MISVTSQSCRINCETYRSSCKPTNQGISRHEVPVKIKLHIMAVLIQLIIAPGQALPAKKFGYKVSPGAKSQKHCRDYPSSHNHGGQKWVPSNSSYISNIAIFHGTMLMGEAE